MSAPAVSAEVSSAQASIRALIASNLYDTKIVPQLEEHVKFQIRTSSYDAEANRELLQLYALAPDMLKLDILARLLVKALMQMPSPDFVTSLYLLQENRHALEPVRLLVKLHTLLDTCQFKKFWQELDAFRAVQQNRAVVDFTEVHDFDQAIRSFITTTISSTFSSLTTAQLKELWNLTEKKALEEAVQAQGWTFAEEGKTVVVKQAQQQQQNAKEETATSARSNDCPSIEQLAKLITA